MKKLAVLFLLLSLTYRFAKAQGYKEYQKILKNELHLYPLSIPDKNYGPGSILKIKKTGLFGSKVSESLIFTQKDAFPSALLLPPSPVPSTVITRVSNVKFNFNVNASTTSSLPSDVLSAVAGLGDTTETTYSFSMKNATLQEIPQSTFDKLILSLDPKKTNDYVLLKSLLDPKTVIVSRGLQVRGFEFTFQRKRKITPSLSAKLTTQALNAGLTFALAGSDSTNFVIQSDSTLYYAYTPYSKDSKQIQQYIDDRKNIDSLNDLVLEAGARIKTLQNENDVLNYQDLKTKSDVYEATINEVKNRAKIQSAARDEGSISNLADTKNVLDRYTNQLEVVNEKMFLYNSNNHKINSLKASIEKLQSRKSDLTNKTYSFIKPMTIDDLEYIYEGEQNQ